MSVWNRVERRVRRWLGRGWSASEFRNRYAAKSADAWGYLEDAAHAARARRILHAFNGFSAQRVLELGCAEGFLTAELLRIARNIVACDLSADAVGRAARYCNSPVNAKFCALDLREELPTGPFDACLASDVLYYLTPGEIIRLAASLHGIMPGARRLVFANEWNSSYRDLTPPERILACLTASGHWICDYTDTETWGDGKSHFLAVLH